MYEYVYVYVGTRSSDRRKLPVFGLGTRLPPRYLELLRVYVTSYHQNIYTTIYLATAQGYRMMLFSLIKRGSEEVVMLSK